MLDQITPLILTFNEEANLPRTLAELKWARRIVVIDSFSTDSTLEILRRYSNVEVFQRRFDCHSAQWNYGLDLVQTDWVLSLDADYVLSEKLVSEISERAGQDFCIGYWIHFRYCVFGKPLHGSLMPPRLALFKKDAGRYFQDGHTQRLKWTGATAHLNEIVLHDDRKSLEKWFQAQLAYSRLEAEKISEGDFFKKNIPDKTRSLIILAPWLFLFYALFFKGCIRDGWRGVFYSFQKTVTELILALFIIEKKFFSKVEN